MIKNIYWKYQLNLSTSLEIKTGQKKSNNLASYLANLLIFTSRDRIASRYEYQIYDSF